MIIRKENIPDLGKSIRRKVLCRIVAVDPLCRKSPRLLPDPVQDQLLPGGLLHISPGKSQIIDGVFHRHVTGKIPAVTVDLIMDIHVAENTVKHDVQIVPDRCLLLVPVTVQDMLGAVQKLLPVRGIGPVIGLCLKLAQGSVKKAQIDQQRTSCKIHDLPRQLVGLLHLRLGHGQTAAVLLRQIHPQIIDKFCHRILPFRQYR